MLRVTSAQLYAYLCDMYSILSSSDLKDNLDTLLTLPPASQSTSPGTRKSTTPKSPMDKPCGRKNSWHFSKKVRSNAGFSSK
jgi:hypothetical protein